MKRVSIVAFMLGLAGVAFAQTPPPAAPEKPAQDPAAVKMIERYDALRHIPRAAGLKDLQFTVRIPVAQGAGLDLVVRWKAPDKVAADLAVPGDTPENLVRQLTLIASQKRGEAKTMAEPMIQLIAGEVVYENWKDDEISLAAPNQVKIVARSARSKAQFKEQLLSFDDRGLVKEARVTAPTGQESVMKQTFVERDKKYVCESVETWTQRPSAGVESQGTNLTFEYANAGDFLLVKKVTVVSGAKGKAPPQILEFRDVKVNSGLDDKVFEEKAAESR